MIDLVEISVSLAEVARLARVDLQSHNIKNEFLPAPHRRPSSFPPGTQAVYAFLLAESCLKVGNAGPKTQARFTSQHYGLDAPSTLAKSILRDPLKVANLFSSEQRSEVQLLDGSSIGSWIEKNTSRVHICIPAEAGHFTLGLVEAFIQCRFQPVFEGKV